LSPPSTDSPEARDERWAIRIFRPLLKSLNIQNIPEPPNVTEVIMADSRDWIIQGMGRCGVFIERSDLPENIGGILITSHDPELDFFKLHILINDRLCDKTGFDNRVEQKITAVHEFVHAVAALSAISKIRTDSLIMRFKEILRQKAHAIYFDDIKRVVVELGESLSVKLNGPRERSGKNHFPDEHFRLGIEDFPVSYPIIFEEFLLSREMFDEYFSRDLVESMCKAISEENRQVFGDLALPIIKKIAEEKALDTSFVVSRVFDILVPIVLSYKIRHGRIAG